MGHIGDGGSSPPRLFSLQTSRPPRQGPGACRVLTCRPDPCAPRSSASAPSCSSGRSSTPTPRSSPDSWPRLGLDLFHKTTVGDNLGRVAAALEGALGRAQVVITTGGLGPTEDDVTREAVARATGRELVFHPDLLGDIEEFFRARGLPLSPSNRKQAYIPRGAIPLPNPVGTAPCFIVEEGDRTLLVLPGVPREMEHLLLTRGLPHLRARYGLQAAIVSRLVRVAGLGESRVGEVLADLMAKGSQPHGRHDGPSGPGRRPNRGQGAGRGGGARADRSRGSGGSLAARRRRLRDGPGEPGRSGRRAARRARGCTLGWSRWAPGASWRSG